MKTLNKLACASATIFSCLLITACHIPTAADGFAMTTGGAGLTEQSGQVEYMIYNVPPQVVYRIDDHRFFTLENYKDCDHGGIVYYNDTKLGKKIYISGGSSSNDILTQNPTMKWQGEFIYSADENIIAYPFFVMYCASDHMDCSAELAYSIDGNKNKLRLGTTTGDDTSDKSIIITNNNIYVKKSHNSRYYSHILSLDSHPEGSGVIIEKNEMPAINKKSISRYFSCSNSIKPSSVTYSKKQSYSPLATGVVTND
ncbi:hypothetical protein J1786_09335 [Rahnella sp. L72c]|uniref:Tli3-like domain-containing protein n=1 Tax=Rahnella perminowiae TaxID=2816244 RepID=A0ABS6KZI7_9GAMM|nr:hypothetical protein [Rahnella perminowiae]MBU9835014.1 hypothetical protein [Rahnella perminowiae]